MRKTNLITIAALLVFLVSDLIDLSKDGFQWLTVLSLLLAAAAIILNVIAGVRHE